MFEQAVGFPTHFTALNRQDLIRSFAEGPQRLRSVLAGLTEEEVGAHPRPGKWSIQEIVLHLADAEVMGAARVRMLYAQPGVTFPVYDQNVFAERFGYRDASRARVDATLRLFEALRATTVPFFENATEEDWQRTGIHPEWGPLTFRNLLELYADHSERHIGQILHLRDVLGKVLHVPLLLKTRLY